MLQVNKFTDLHKLLGTEILHKIAPSIACALEKGESLSTSHISSTDFPYITSVLTETNKPFTQDYNGQTVEFKIEPTFVIDLKKLVDENTDLIALGAIMGSNTDFIDYNLNEEDKAECLKKAKGFALSMLKSGAKLFSIYLHKEFMANYKIHVESYQDGGCFQVLGYFSTDPSGARKNAIYIDAEAFSSRFQKDCKQVQRTSERTDKINADYESIKSTSYADTIKANIQNSLPAMKAAGQQFGKFVNAYNNLKAGAAKKAAKKPAENTVASSDLDTTETKPENGE
jgi:hypothetical protein